MQSLRDLVSPEFDTERWVAAPAGFICDSCGARQEKGSPISWIFHGNGEWERGEWEWNPPDCTQCEIRHRVEHEINEISSSTKNRSSQGDFNAYTKGYWEEQIKAPVPEELDKLVEWVAARHDLITFQKVLANLRLEGDEPDSQYYLDEDGEVYDREEVDWWKALRVQDLPEKPELGVRGEQVLAALREIDPSHPIVVWLG